MTHKLKALGLTLMAICLIGAVGASGAQATKFTSAKYPTSLTGTQTSQHVFQTMFGAVKCDAASFTGSLAAASSTITLAPTYSKCTTSGLSVTITMNGCDFLIHNTIDISTHASGGNLDIQCPAGKQIVIDEAETGCTKDIGPQTGLGLMTYTINTEGGDMNFDFTIKGIKYTVTGSGLFCFEPGSYTDGTYTGTATFKGSNGVLTVD